MPLTDRLLQFIYQRKKSIDEWLSWLSWLPLVIVTQASDFCLFWKAKHDKWNGAFRDSTKIRLMNVSPTSLSNSNVRIYNTIVISISGFFPTSGFCNPNDDQAVFETWSYSDISSLILFFPIVIANPNRQRLLFWIVWKAGKYAGSSASRCGKFCALS